MNFKNDQVFCAFNHFINNNFVAESYDNREHAKSLLESQLKEYGYSKSAITLNKCRDIWERDCETQFHEEQADIQGWSNAA